MYRLESSKEFYRCNPWDKPYKVRIEALKDGKSLGKKNVAVLYPKFDSSTFRYRGYNIVETLEYSFRWSGAFFELDDISCLTEDFEYIDIFIICRCAWDNEIENLVKLVHKNGSKVCYDIDDLVYNPEHLEHVIEALSLNKDTEWNFWYGQAYRFKKLIELCDATITTNKFLANILNEDFDKPSYVIKNYLNWMQESVSKEYFDSKIKLNSEDDFTIGYFSGSPTHLNDLLKVMPEIEEFMAENGNVKLNIVGYMNLPDKYQYLIKKGKIEYVPFQTFIGLQYEQAIVDVNIVPLVNNKFSNCKSELKYFESGIVGTVTCATPSYTYSSAIKDGENGFLCEVGEWFPRFKEIYNYNADKIKSLQKKVCEASLKEYAGINQLDTVETIFDSIIRM